MIKSLSLTNFRKHSAVDLYFEDPMQMILISGKNGVGKTTILESILYGLYGESRHGKKYLDQLVKRGAELEGMSVELTLNLNDVIYRVHRRRDNKISTAVLYANENPLVEGANEVTQEITKILGLDSAGFKLAVLAQQKELEGLSTLRPSERSSMVSKLLRLDLLAKAKDEAQSHFRREREIYKELQIITSSEGSEIEVEVLNQQLKDINTNEQNLLSEKYRYQKEIDSLSHIPDEYQKAQIKLKVVQENLASNIIEIENIENQIKSIVLPKIESVPTLDLQELTEEIIEVEKNISEAEQNEIAKKRKNSLLEEIQSLESSIDEKNIILDSLLKINPSNNQTLENYTSEKKTLENKIQNSSVEIQNIEYVISSNLSAIANIEKSDSLCSLCHQEISIEHKNLEIENLKSDNETQNNLKLTVLKNLEIDKNIFETINKKIIELVNVIKLEELDHQKSTYINNEIKDLKLRSSSLKLQLDQLQVRDYDVEELYLKKNSLAKMAITIQRGIEQNKNRSELLAKSNLLNSKLSELYSTRNSLNSLLKDSEVSATLIGQYNKLQELNLLIQELDKKVNSCNSQALVLSEKISNLKNSTEMINQRNLRKDIHQTNAINYSNAALLISDVSDLLAQEIKPLLEGHVTNILSLMSNGRFSKVQISDDYDITVFDDNKFRQLSELSGGECDLVSLALRLALSQVVSQRHGSGGCGFLILDECFASQDSERREAVLTSLRNLKDIYRQIFIVSHIEHIDDYVDLVVNIEISEDRSDTEVVCL